MGVAEKDGDAKDSKDENKEVMPIEEEEEGTKAKALRQPYQPTQKDIDEHELTHVPFRDWCVHCMKGRGQSNQHRSDQCKKMEGEEITAGAITTFSIDYMFYTKENELITKDEAAKMDADKLSFPVLVGKDRKSKAIIAHKVEAKGKGNGWIVKRLIADLEELGYGGTKIIIKCDQENAIVEVQRELTRRRQGLTVPINSAVGDSKGNGDVESAVKRLRGQVRTMKDDLEAKLKHKLNHDSTTVDWMINWAAGIITRYSKDSSGKTSYEEIRGKGSSTPIAAFGERILFMPKLEDKQQSRFSSGIFLGLQAKSNEAIIGTETGVYKARTLRRLAPDAKWDIEYLKKMVGTPYEPVPGRPGEGITMGKPEDANMEKQDDQAGVDAELAEIPTNEARAPAATRKMYVRKADVEKYGNTSGCNGCTAALTGERWPNGRTIPHNNECRQRMGKLMENDEAGKSRLKTDAERQQRQNMWKQAQATTTAESSAPTEEQANKDQQGADTQMGNATTEAPKNDEKNIEDEHMNIGERTMDEDGNDVDVTPKSKDAPLGPEHFPIDSDGDDELLSPTISYRTDAPDSPSKAVMHCDIKCWEFGGESGAKESKDVGNVDVSEVFSPPRVADMAMKMGLTAGTSFDITTVDEHGEPWDFNIPRMRHKARMKIQEERPELLIGSPVCTMWSQMMNINKDRMDPLEYKERLNQARTHLKFVCELYIMQHEAGRYYLHEHPQGASSWKEQCIIDVMKQTLGERLTIHQCMYGLTSVDTNGETNPARKATDFLTNCPGMALTLSTLCDGTHRHTRLEGGKRTKAAQVYPEQLCRAIVGGLVLQKRWDKNGQYFLGTVEITKDDTSDSIGAIPPEEDESDMMQEAWDDVNGAELDPKEVRKARKLELKYYDDLGAYIRVPVRQCIERTGKKPIQVRWIDHNKGDKDRPNIRCRLVAKQYNTGVDDGYFAATPPIEALRLVLSNTTTGRSRTKVLMINDVSRAYMHAEAAPDIYVDECEEAMREGDTEPMCWLTTKSMYGTRPAAKQWQMEFTKTLVDAGFEAGKASPVVFNHRKRGLMVFVHGDDFVSSGEEADVNWLKKLLEQKYPIKTTIMGNGAKHLKEARVLNRIIRWHDDVGLSYEADPRHAEEIIRQSGAEGMKSVTSPMVKPDHDETTEDRTNGIEVQKKCGSKVQGGEASDLSREQVRQYRGIAARGNFLAMDRGDLIYSVKECSRSMANPVSADWQKLVRLGRYLLFKPRVVNWYKYQEEPEHLSTYTDSDWAGCRKTRRSTSGGCIMLGNHMVKMWSRTQATIALSSAEAELYATVKASAESMGIVSLMKDAGKLIKAHVFGDASAALGIIARKGLGKVRHLNTSYLWVQEKAANDEIKYSKIPGQKNIADLFTKPLDWQTLMTHTESMSCKFTEGRDDMGYQIAHVHRGVQDRPRPIRPSGLKDGSKAWCRTDLNTKTLKGTMRGGPKWSEVTRRLTYEADTGMLMHDEDARWITRAQESAVIGGGGSYDTITMLVYKPGAK